MRKLNVRQGGIAGTVVSLVLAASVSARSTEPVTTFIYALAFGLVATLSVVGVGTAINNRNLGTDALASGDNLGGFWIRTVAFAFDWTPFVLIGLLLAPLGAVSEAILLGIGFVYFVGLWTVTGQTLGMLVVGLRVVREDGGTIGWGNAVRRFFGLFAAFLCLYIGVIWVAFDSRKRGWADLVGGTLVIRTS